MMKSKLRLMTITVLFLSGLYTAESKEYSFTTTGMPFGSAVNILGTEYHLERGPQYDTTFVAETVTVNDITVTIGGGYVYHISIDNDNCRVSIEFKHCFLPTASLEAGVQYEYLLKTPEAYIKVDDSGLHLTPKKSEADRIVFVEDSRNVGRYYIFDADSRCYITCRFAADDCTLIPTERNKSLTELTSPVQSWKLILRDDMKSVSIISGTGDAPEENTWLIKPYSQGSLACATTTFSLPGREYMHKIIPEDGFSVVDVDFGSITTLKLYDDRSSVGNQYKYIRGVAPEEEGVYTYLVKLQDRDGAMETVPVKFTVSSFLQSPTPVMGWLSWNWFTREVSHKKIVELAKGMERLGLVDAGYNFLVLDDTWATNQTDQAKLTFDPEKFPKGMKGLIGACRKVNSNFRLGLYSDAGLMTCASYQPGSYGYEVPHAELFDRWGVDMLKYDFCHSQASAYESYAAMGAAIAGINEKRRENGGKPFVFYLCEWGKFYSYMWAAEVGGSMWRASGDSRENWIGNHKRTGVLAIVDETRHMWMWAGVNRFNDLDMTLIGLHGLGCPSNNTSEYLDDGGVIPGLTDEQARSNMALWCMLSSPLLMSCDFRIHPKAEGNKTAGTLPSPLLTKEDIATVSNKYLIGINQDAMGQQAEYMENLSTGAIDYSSTGYDVYVKDLTGGRTAVSVTNRASTVQKSVTIPFKELYLQESVCYSLTDVWTGTVSDAVGSLSTGDIEPYQTKVYVISANSSKR